MAGNKEDPRKSIITIAVSFLLVGLGFIALGIVFKMKDINQRNACTETATAMVVRTEKKDGKHDMYRAVLLYSTKDGKITNVTTPWTAKQYNDNEAVEIRYDPEDAEHIYIDSHKPYSAAGGVLMPFMGVCCLLFSLMIFIVLKKKNRKTSANKKKKEL